MVRPLETAPMDCNHDQALSPEMDAAVARAAIAEHDLPHAAHHVAGALAADPHRPDLLAVLDELVHAATGVDAALELFSLAGGTWYGAAAVHARLLATTDPDNAFDLLCQIAAVRPDVPYLGWAAAWATRLDPAAAATSVGRLLAIDASPGTQAIDGALIPALDVLHALRHAHPDESTLWPIASMLTRRAGRPTEAWELARTAFQRFPSWNSAVALANACKVVDRWDEAQDAWRAAIGFDPDDVSVRLDWADTLLDRWELDLARARYQEVLDRNPDHPWAVPSVLYVDWARHPTTDRRLSLSAFAVQHPDNERARHLADQATPWIGRLPPPQEATISLLPALRTGNIRTMSTALSHLEAPSSQLAARRFMASLGGELGFGVAAVPHPDPRLPFGTPRWALWTWHGIDADPAMGPPDDPAAGEVFAKLASSRYHAGQWLDHGVQIARQHGFGDLDANAAEQLLRAALHPPAGPGWAEPWDWQYRIAHAAALVFAGYPGWDGTVHRDALLSLLAARNDWFAIAAVTALTERARVDPVVRDEVRQLLQDVRNDAPDAGYWCVGWPVTCALLRLGDDDPALIEALRRHEDPVPDA